MGDMFIFRNQFIGQLLVQMVCGTSYNQLSDYFARRAF